MSDTRIKLYGGKYEVIHNETTGELRALRHGQEWRSLNGDGLALSMLTRITDLERENGAWKELSARMADEMRGLDHEFASLRDYDAALVGKEGQQ